MLHILPNEKFHFSPVVSPQDHDIVEKYITNV